MFHELTDAGAVMENHIGIQNEYFFLLLRQELHFIIFQLPFQVPEPNREINFKQTIFPAVDSVSIRHGQIAAGSFN